MRTPLALAALALTLASAPVARAQGCALCRDNTAATPVATQQAFRHSIEFIGAAAFAFFAATLAIAWRLR